MTYCATLCADVDYPKSAISRQLPATQLVLCEPFVIRCGVVMEAWDAEIEQRREIVKRLAGTYEAKFVPFQSAMDAALKLAPAERWVIDGVHPTLAGHRVLAECWYEAVLGEKMG